MPEAICCSVISCRHGYDVIHKHKKLSPPCVLPFTSLRREEIIKENCLTLFVVVQTIGCLHGKSNNTQVHLRSCYHHFFKFEE